LEALEEDGAESLSDPAAARLEAFWEEEWQRHALGAAVARVKRTANPKHFQVFDYCVLKEWPVTKVAATLGISAAQVYLAKHRVSRLVRQAARKVCDEWSGGA
jgi:RNA polymerase sigma-70 factor (ECF subfamily)